MVPRYVITRVCACVFVSWETKQLTKQSTRMLHPKEVYGRGVRYADEVMESARTESEERRTEFEARRSRGKAKRAKTEPPSLDLDATFGALTDAIRNSSIGSIPYPTTVEEADSLLKQVEEFHNNMFALKQKYHEVGLGHVSIHTTDAVAHYSMLRDHLARKQRTVEFPTLSVRFSHFPQHEVPESSDSFEGLKPARDAECFPSYKHSSKYTAARPALYPVPGRDGMFYLKLNTYGSEAFLCREPGTIYSLNGRTITFMALSELKYEVWDYPRESSRDMFKVTIPKNGSIFISKQMVETFGYMIHDAILIPTT